jgi:spermidine synthase
MFAINAFAEPIFAPLFYTLCAAIGIMVGLEIPLLVRILRATGGVSEAISHVLALDYLGALAGSVLFPLVALPFIGLSRTSVVFGLMNLAVAGVGLALIEGRKTWIALRLVAASLLLVVAFAASARLVGFLEDLLYQDNVILTRQTIYQRIVLTRWRDDVRLYLDGHIQFSSVDEARYHEALVLPAMEAVPGARQVLILGGGDGLAAREVLKYPAVEGVTLVDIDPAMTELARTRPELVALNQDALASPKVHLVNADAMAWLGDARDTFDVILIDLPDPSTPALSKLYSSSFYALATRRLALGGVLVTQATSPFFAREAFSCIVETIAAAVPEDHPAGPLLPLPYHFHVPSFGEWGFVMAARHQIDPQALSVHVPARVLNDATLHAMFVFDQDMSLLEVEPNRLDDPVLHRYYEQGWQRFNQ